MVTMQQAVSAFTNFFDGNNIKYNLINEDGHHAIISRTSIQSKLRNMTIFVEFIPDDRNPNTCIRFASYGIPDMSIDENCKAQILDYITRINYAVNLGHFEMDVGGCRDLRYKVTHEVDNYMPGDYVITRMLSVPYLVLEKYGDGLLAISMGFLSGEEAFRQATNK